MENLSDFLQANIENLYSIMSEDNLTNLNNQVVWFTSQATFGTPSFQYSSGLDKIFPKAQPTISSTMSSLGYSSWVYKKSLKQLTNINLSSWNPGISVFTPEGLGTTEYSPWVKEPLNDVFNSNSRVQRITYTYVDRSKPLRGTSGPYTLVDDFDSAFWISLSTSGSPIVNQAVEFLLDKSFFLASKHSDSSLRPVDIKIYTNSNLKNNYSSGSGWVNNSITYYQAFSDVNFTISKDPTDKFKITLDVGAETIGSGSQYQHYLICVGSDYVASSTGSVLPVAGQSLFVKPSPLKFIKDCRYDSIYLPKAYDSKPIKTVLNTNQPTLSGNSVLDSGDIVVLLGQNKSSENGMYIVNTGSWINLSDYLVDNYHFIQSRSATLTGSPILYSVSTDAFDAPQPVAQIISLSNDNYNQSWAQESPKGFKSYSSINYTGPIFEDFGVKEYTFDYQEVDSIGTAGIDYSDYENKVTINQPYISTKANISGYVESVNLTRGSIQTIYGTWSALNNTTIAITSSPSDFAIAEVITSSSGTAQIVVKKIFGTLETNRLVLLDNFVIFGNITVDDKYQKTLETYQRQILTPMQELLLWGQKNITFINNMRQALIYDKNPSINEIRSAFINEAIYFNLAKKYGYETASEFFNKFKEFGNIKSIGDKSLQGFKIKTDVNFLNNDEEFIDNQYEFLRQVSKGTGFRKIAENSITSQSLASLEFEPSYLDITSVGGEISTSYIAQRPFFTGPNLSLSSTNYNNRVELQDEYGNTYSIKESYDFNNHIETNGIVSSFSNKYPNIGGQKSYIYDSFWSQYSGSYVNGAVLSDSLYVMGNLSDPSKSFTSTRTVNRAYSLGSNNAELIFTGKAIYIPIPSINHNGILSSVEIYLKRIGSTQNNGFLSASIVDLTDFFLTNDTNSIKTFSTSNNVSINFINDSYSPVRFTFKDDSSYLTRNNLGQNLFLAINKSGDFGPGYMIFRCANTKQSNLYQDFSGSSIYSNIKLSSTVSITTGSSIYNLFHYIGNETYTTTTIDYPNTFSTQYIRFPYITNVNLESFNNEDDYINVQVSPTNIFAGRPRTTFISLGSVAGIDTLSFTMYSSLGSGSKIVTFGATGPSINQKPLGFYVLLGAEKVTEDNIQSAYICLERNFVFNTLSTPELTLYFTDGYSKACFNGPLDDISILTSEKQSVTNYFNTISRSDQVLEKRKLSWILPRMLFTGSAIFGGINTTKTVDFIFKSSFGQSYIRKTINPTAGIVANTYIGSPNGILNDNSELSLITSQNLIFSMFTGPNFTGSLLNTNIFINFNPNSGSSQVNISTNSNNLIKISNYTTGMFTGPGSGPSLSLVESLTGSRIYNYMISLYGPPSLHTATITYNNNILYVSSGSLFPSSQASEIIDHPENLGLADISVVDSGNKIKYIDKRFTR